MAPEVPTTPTLHGEPRTLPRLVPKEQLYDDDDSNRGQLTSHARLQYVESYQSSQHHHAPTCSPRPPTSASHHADLKKAREELAGIGSWGDPAGYLIHDNRSAVKIDISPFSSLF